MKAIMALGKVSIIEVISDIVHTVNSIIMVAVTVVVVVIMVDFMLVATPVTIQMSQQMMGLGMSRSRIAEDGAKSGSAYGNGGIISASAAHGDCS
jgi:hypothetical protein